MEIPPAESDFVPGGGDLASFETEGSVSIGSGNARASHVSMVPVASVASVQHPRLRTIAAPTEVMQLAAARLRAQRAAGRIERARSLFAGTCAVLAVTVLVLLVGSSFVGEERRSAFLFTVAIVDTFLGVASGVAITKAGAAILALRHLNGADPREALKMYGILPSEHAGAFVSPFGFGWCPYEGMAPVRRDDPRTTPE